MRYKLILDVYGGEYCLGTTTKEVVDYWSKRTNDELIEHMTGDTIKDVPDEYNLYPFFDQTDVIHTNGVELNDHNHIEVIYEKTGETIFEGSLGSCFTRERMLMVDNPFVDLREGHPLIYSSSSEKGSWEYELEIDTEFDPKLLKFYLHDLEGNFVIDNIQYDGLDCEFVDGTTRGVGFEARFGEIYDDGKETISFI